MVIFYSYILSKTINISFSRRWFGFLSDLRNYRWQTTFVITLKYFCEEEKLRGKRRERSKNFWAWRIEFGGEDGTIENNEVTISDMNCFNIVYFEFFVYCEPVNVCIAWKKKNVEKMNSPAILYVVKESFSIVCVM